MDSHSNGRRNTVLVVDDEPLVRNRAARVLEDAGYLVLQAAGAADALALMETVVPDVLVTDIVMPAMDGVDLAVEARRRSGRIRTVFLSGFANSARAAYATRLGRVLDKPVRAEDLRKAVAVAAARNTSRQSAVLLVRNPHPRLRFSPAAPFSALAGLLARQRRALRNRRDVAALLRTDHEETAALWQRAHEIGAATTWPRLAGLRATF